MDDALEASCGAALPPCIVLCTRPLQAGAAQERWQVLLAGAVHDHHPRPRHRLFQYLAHNLVCHTS